MLWFVLAVSFVVGIPAILAVAVAFGRLWRRARRKGYRGLAVPTTLMVLPPAIIVGVAGAIAVVADGWDPPNILIPPLSFSLLLGSVLVAYLLACVIVYVLPPRNNRHGGARRAGFPFKLTGYAAATLTIALPTSSLLFDTPPNTVSNMVRLPLLTGAAAYFSFAAANRKDKPHRDREQSADPRPPVLYVRGFAEETRMFARRPSGPQEVAAGKILDLIYAQYRMYATFEEYFEPTIRTEIGSWYGLGNPTDYLPPRGVRRIYSSDTGWREKFRGLVSTSGCILTSPGTWPNMGWELDVIKELNCRQKLFVLTPPQAGVLSARRRAIGNWSTGTRLTTWQAFTDAAAEPDRETGRSADYEFGADPGPGAVVTFDHDGQPMVLTRLARDPVGYVSAIREHLHAQRSPQR